MLWLSPELPYFLLASACTLAVMATTDSKDSLSLPQDLDIDEEESDSGPATAPAGQQIQLYRRNNSRAVKAKKDSDYFLRPPFFPLVLKKKSDDYLFPTNFYSKKIFVTKDGLLLSDSKDTIMTHFQRQLLICHKIFTSKRRYFLHNPLNKHHEFTQLANALWDRYKDIEISVNKLFLEVPLNLKYKLKQFHIDKRGIKLEDWWNIEHTLDLEFTSLFNRIRYDLYKAFDRFDAELHMTCFHFDKHLIEISTEEEPTVATIRKLHFNDSLVDGSEEIAML